MVLNECTLFCPCNQIRSWGDQDGGQGKRGKIVRGKTGNRSVVWMLYVWPA